MITLEWIPTNALVDWASAHLYYLPEVIARDDLGPWAITLQELILTLNEHKYRVSLDIHPGTEHHLCTETQYRGYEEAIPNINTPYQIGNDYYIKTKAAVFKLDTSLSTPIWVMVKSIQA